MSITQLSTQKSYNNPQPTTIDNGGIVRNISYNKLVTDMTNVIEKLNDISPTDGQISPPSSAVTQITNISTAVELNYSAGVITTVALTAVAGATAGTFAVTNSFVTASSVILLTEEYASTATGIPKAVVASVGTGTFSITLSNVAPTDALNAVAKIHFLIL